MIHFIELEEFSSVSEFYFVHITKPEQMQHIGFLSHGMVKGIRVGFRWHVTDFKYTDFAM